MLQALPTNQLYVISHGIILKLQGHGKLCTLVGAGSLEDGYADLSLFGPRLYHGNDSYLCGFVAIENDFHDHLMRLVEKEGCDTARFPGSSLAPRDELATRCIVRGCPPFSILYDHIIEFGLTPQVLIEPDHSQPMGFHIVAITTKEQFNWISLFMHDPQQTRDMAQVCDLTISNMGRMMII